MKKLLAILVQIMVAATSLRAFGAPAIPANLHQGPDKRTIMQIQSDFLQLTEPPDYTVDVKRVWNIPVALRGVPGASPVPEYRLVLRGEAKDFAEQYHPADVALALKPFLKDPEHDAEACIIINGVLKGASEAPFSTFRSRANPGNWEQVKKSEVALAAGGVSSYLSNSLADMTVYRNFMKYRIPPDQVLPSSLKKNEESSLVSSATPVETPTATPQATPSQTPTPQGKGTVEPPKTTPSATMAEPEPKPQPTPAAHTESQKQAWPLWLAGFAVVLGAIGVVIHRNRKK